MNQAAPRSAIRRPILALVGISLLMLLAALAVWAGWFRLRPALALGGQPAWLFFNSQIDCHCGVVSVYQAADRQIEAWVLPGKDHLPLHRILIEERPDLAKKYRVVRAPTLILLDAQGQEIWRQADVVSDENPLDLAAALSQAQVLLQKANP